MAYEKQTWQTGETITAEKLNHMEEGIAEEGMAPLLVIFTWDDTGDKYLSDKTFGEVRTAFESGRPVFVHAEYHNETAGEHGVSNEQIVSVEYEYGESSVASATVLTEKGSYYAITIETVHALEVLDSCLLSYTD